MGCNAIRTAHTPPTPELLDACDRLGMLVMDEHRMMGTTDELIEPARAARAARPQSPQHCHLVHRQRGSRSRAATSGARGGRHAAAGAHARSDTRPCTQAMNNSWGRGLSNVIDVQGFNYKQSRRRDRRGTDRRSPPSL